MNAVELFHQDGKSAHVYYCGKCRIIHPHKPTADRCCHWVCETCGKHIPNYHLTCSECQSIAEAKREQERFEKAEKITDWDGWVYCDGLGNDGYAESLDELLDYCEPDEVPEYVWTCKSNAFAQVDIDDILQQIEENGYTDFDASDLDGIAELEAAIDAFNEANKGVLSYEPDYKRAVLIKKST